MPDVVIYGTMGMGRDAVSWMDAAGTLGDVRGFITHTPDEIGGDLVGFPILGGLSYPLEHPGTAVVLAAGNTPKRVAALDYYTSHGVPLVRVVHPTAVIAHRVVVGDGTIVCPGVILCTDVTIGRGAILNYGAIVGHDCTVDDGAFLGPGSNLAGTVEVGRGAHIGLGASVVQKHTIGARAVVGAGAVVVTDVDADTTVVGVPARPLVGKSGLPPVAPLD